MCFSPSNPKSPLLILNWVVLFASILFELLGQANGFIFKNTRHGLLFIIEAPVYRNFAKGHQEYGYYLMHILNYRNPTLAVARFPLTMVSVSLKNKICILLSEDVKLS